MYSGSDRSTISNLTNLKFIDNIVQMCEQIKIRAEQANKNWSATNGLSRSNTTNFTWFYADISQSISE